MNKNGMAALITYFIALTFSWFIWGHTSKHIWSAWLFIILLLVSVIIFILNLINELKADEFNKLSTFSAFGTILHGLFLLSSVGDINITPLSVLTYVFAGFLGVFLVFVLVRYIQNQQI